MKFNQATLVALLSSATAVLGAPECNSGPVDADDVSIAVELLESSSTKIYHAPGDALEPILFFGRIGIFGVADGPDETSSYARDIASAVREITENCVTTDGIVFGGSNYVAGNGEFLVKVLTIHPSDFLPSASPSNTPTPSPTGPSLIGIGVPGA